MCCLEGMMSKFLYAVGIWWMVIWALYTFWTQLFMSPLSFLIVGAVSVVIVGVITCIGTSDLGIFPDDDDYSDWS